MNERINNNVEEIIANNFNLIKDIKYVMNQKYILDDKDLSINLEKKANELYLLQKKRKSENPEINVNYMNNDFIFQKGNNFPIYNSNKIEVNINQQSESKNEEVVPQSYCINFEKNNSEHFDSSIYDKIKQNNKKNQNLSNEKKKFFYPIKNNFNENIKILGKDQSKESLNNQTSHFIEKKNYFNVVQEGKPKNKINKEEALNSEKNNEIKVLKNNKAVYINKYLLYSYSSLRNLKKLNKTFFVGRNKRSSKYRGVSKNGYQWQVLMMINNNKYYLGSYPSEELAARIYDIVAIKNRGIKARTNFVYNNNQIEKICKNVIDLKSENISDIIEELIK